MSKFLRFIVNLFIVVAVLTAAAILVPPLAGVHTTIVDSASMDTNLPLGSITYARSVARSDIAAGDEVLRETSGAVYAYVIREVGENGTYTAVSAVDDSASAQTIELGDPVFRVAVMVPWIGYVVMALQSTEGILILVLIAVLVIVLFILSELWKPADTEEEEEEEEHSEDTPAAAELPGADDGGIDTDVIRQAMNENNDELAAAGPAEKIAELTDVRQDETEPDGADSVRKALFGIRENTDTASESADENAVPAAEEEPAEEEPAEESGYRETPDTGSDKKRKSWHERRADKKAKKKAEKDRKNSAAAEVTPYAEENAAEETEAVSARAPEQAPSHEEAAASPAAFSVNTAEENGAADQGGESRTDVSAAGTEAEMTKAPHAEDARHAETAAPEIPYDPDRFIPVNRPTLGELLDEARKSGDKPKVKEDEATGITTVDYTDVV